jgi:hypothetical protein
VVISTAPTEKDKLDISLKGREGDNASRVRLCLDLRCTVYCHVTFNNGLNIFKDKVSHWNSANNTTCLRELLWEIRESRGRKRAFSKSAAHIRFIHWSSKPFCEREKLICFCILQMKKSKTKEVVSPQKLPGWWQRWETRYSFSSSMSFNAVSDRCGEC